MTNTTRRAPVQLVAEFMEKFDVPKDPVLWSRLVREEQAEFCEAVANLFKEAADLVYVVSGLINSVGDAEALEIGQTIMMEVVPPVMVPFFLAVAKHPMLADVVEAVHASNMSKLGDDGKPLRREDGKILKGPNYRAPDILAILSKRGGSVH